MEYMYGSDIGMYPRYYFLHITYYFGFRSCLWFMKGICCYSYFHFEAVLFSFFLSDSFMEESCDDLSILNAV